MNEMNQLEQNQAPVEQPAEKMIPQSEVNSIVASRIQQVAAKAKQEAMMEMQQQQQMQNQPQGQPQQMQQQAQQQQYQPPQQVNVDQIYQQVQERLNKDNAAMQEQLYAQQQQQHMQERVRSYQDNLNQGSKAYDDFSDITKDYDPAAFPNVTYLLADNPKAADIIYYMSQNPEKALLIEQLADRSAVMGKNALNKVAESIQNNQQGQMQAQNYQTNAPLDHMQPSRVSGSNGKMSISDLRKDPRFRV